jgi:hypothetical protein
MTSLTSAHQILDKHIFAPNRLLITSHISSRDYSKKSIIVKQINDSIMCSKSIKFFTLIYPFSFYNSWLP